MSDVMNILTPIVAEAMENEQKQAALTCASIVLFASMRPENPTEWAFEFIRTAFELTDEELRANAIETALLLGEAMKLEEIKSGDFKTEMGKLFDVLYDRLKRISAESVKA